VTTGQFSAILGISCVNNPMKEYFKLDFRQRIVGKNVTNKPLYAELVI